MQKFEICAKQAMFFQQKSLCPVYGVKLTRDQAVSDPTSPPAPCIVCANSDGDCPDMPLRYTWAVTIAAFLHGVAPFFYLITAQSYSSTGAANNGGKENTEAKSSLKKPTHSCNATTSYDYYKRQRLAVIIFLIYFLFIFIF